MLHEPLVNKFRDHAALAKKVSRALGRGEVGDAARLQRLHTPRITLDHIIKERYPTFADALRDLDDALSMLFLFANLPSTTTVPPKTIAHCQRLCLEFEHYLINTHSLRKSFLSIKGIYYQATVDGQDILWLVPYRFVQRVTGDIDFRIMGTFIQFYITLLGFVNYRLYTSIGLVYPPDFNAKSDEGGGELDAFAPRSQNVEKNDSASNQVNVLSNGTSAEGHRDDGAVVEAQAIADKISVGNDNDQHLQQRSASPSDEESESEHENDVDKFPDPIDSTADALAPAGPSARALSINASKLFKPYVFYLSRETPRAPLEFILKAFGCQRVGWDTVLGDGAFTNDEKDTRITHQIVDRPPVPIDTQVIDAMASNDDSGIVRSRQPSRVPGRIYVQPQWIWDCINQGQLLPADKYAPGATLPPHLSPFVKPRARDYVPSEAYAEESYGAKTAEATTSALSKADATAVENGAGANDNGNESEPGPDWDGFSSEEDASLGSQEQLSIIDKSAKDIEDGVLDDDELDNDVELEDAEDISKSLDVEVAYQTSLELEAAGVPVSEWPANVREPTQSLRDTPSKANGSKSMSNKKQQSKAKEEEWDVERRKMMMPRRKRKLYEKMVYSNSRKEEENERLRSKKRKIEQDKARTRWSF